jgi:preprotein translocase subunit YajC
MLDQTHPMWTLAQGVSGSDAIAAPGAASAATTTTSGTPVPGPGAATGSPFGGGFLVMMFGLLALMIIMQVMAGRREKKKRAELMASLKKGDKVMTIAGILGTIEHLRDDEVVLKVDPNLNAKITFSRSAIQTIISPSSGPAADTAPSVEVKAKGEKAVAR